MYEIYKTKSIILRRRESGESNADFLVFSRDFGLIWASASGIRKESSKIKSILQSFNYSYIFLVKGKNNYRITGGEEIENLFFSTQNLRKEKIQIFKNTLSLLEQMLIKNHQDTKAFDLIFDFGFDLFLEDNKKNLKKKEIIFLVNFLYHFGYFDERLVNDLEVSNLDEKNIQKIIFEINTQLKKIAF